MKKVMFNLNDDWGNRVIELTISECPKTKMLIGRYTDNMPRVLRGKKWQLAMQKASEAK